MNMPAEKELLTHPVTACRKDINGKGFCIASGIAPALHWRIIPERNLLQLFEQGHECLERQLEPRLMQLLCLLSQADGSVLTRDVLMDSLWPHVVVNENSLTRAVSELRKALAWPATLSPASANSTNSLIETVPKRGYRLNARLVPDPELTSESTDRSGLLPTRLSIFHNASVRYPAIAAAMLISAALSSFWTVRLSSVQQSDPTMLTAQSVVQTSQHTATQAAASSLQTPHLQDRVVGDSPDLPEGLQWLESVHSESDRLPVLESSFITHSVLAPGGQMLAYVEEFQDQSQLRLRSLTQPDEAWTVFTSRSPISHLQWSPLDAGLLFTVHELDGAAHLATGTQLPQVSRLMLLDLETLQIRELYRRTAPAGEEGLRTVGNLT